MKLQFFYVNETTGIVLDDAHYTDRIASMAIDAYRAGDFSSEGEAKRRYLEMDHGYSKYMFDSEEETMKEAVKRLTGIDYHPSNIF